MSATIRETNFDLPGQVGEPYHGKVGDTYTIAHAAGELLAVVRTDRISAFDVVLPETIPLKGQVLNQMSAELLELTREVAPNWLITAADPNASIGHKAEPFKVEMIMRGFLLGTSWRNYRDGARNICGNQLPDGMTEFEPFDSVLLTPTTKAEAGHDEDILPGQIIDQGLATEGEYLQMERLAFDLFAAGQAKADREELILADTKYEFGRLVTGQIVVIDEVHTPDSSRYFPKDEYNDYLEGKTDQRPEQLSKEFVREWLSAPPQSFNGEPGQTPPHMSQEFRAAISKRYIGLFERMLGHPFVAASEDNEADQLERIRASLVDTLNNLAA